MCKATRLRSEVIGNGFRTWPLHEVFEKHTCELEWAIVSRSGFLSINSDGEFFLVVIRDVHGLQLARGHICGFRCCESLKIVHFALVLTSDLKRQNFDSVNGKFARNVPWSTVNIVAVKFTSLACIHEVFAFLQDSGMVCQRLSGGTKKDLPKGMANSDSKP